jgi:hypothetical protein
MLTMTTKTLELNDYLDHGRLVFIDALATTASAQTGAAIFTSINKALSATSPDVETILILDFPDVPLALQFVSSDDLLTEILCWRTQAHAVLVTMSADILTQGPDHGNSSASSQLLLLQQQQMLLSLAHQADVTFSSKGLDTGSSKDVSGVVRITSRTDRTGMGKELLYFVDTSSSKAIKVWERGDLRS